MPWEQFPAGGVYFGVRFDVAWLIVSNLIQAPAPPQADLSLLLNCGPRPEDVRLSILNPTQADTAVLLGIALANGRWYLPRELVVELRRNGSSDVEELVYRGPVNIAGRIDHWVLALPAEAAFTLSLRPADFMTTAAAPAVGPPEEIRIRLTGRPITADLNVDLSGMKTWALWTGTVTSNALRVSDCPR